jgi:hypothetical protein
MHCHYSNHIELHHTAILYAIGFFSGLLDVSDRPRTGRLTALASVDVERIAVRVEIRG